MERMAVASAAAALSPPASPAPALLTSPCRCSQGGRGHLARGHRPAPLNSAALLGGAVSLGRITFPTYWLFALAAAAVLAAAVWLVVERTSLGLAIRAATQDPTMAAVLGINVQRLNTIVFGRGSGLAGAAGVILGTMTSLSPQIGAGIGARRLHRHRHRGARQLHRGHRRLAAPRPGPELRRGAPARLPHAVDLPRDSGRARAAPERSLSARRSAGEAPDRRPGGGGADPGAARGRARVLGVLPEPS